MDQPINHTPHHSSLPQEDTIDLKKLIYRLFHNWYWFLLSVLIAGAAAFAYNRYTTTVYQVESTVLFEGEYGKSSAVLGELGTTANVFQGLGGMASMQNIFNQVVILNSTPIVNKALDQLDFEVSYYNVGRVKVSEAYGDLPFRVVYDKEHPQLVGNEFHLTILPNGKLEISAEGENVMVFDYTTQKMIKWIPEFSFSRTIESGTKLTSNECFGSAKSGFLIA